MALQCDRDNIPWSWRGLFDSGARLLVFHFCPFPLLFQAQIRRMACASPPVLFEDLARFVLLALLAINIHPRPLLENLAIWAVLAPSWLER